MSKKDAGYYFTGFLTPNGTMVPDVVFDEIMVQLTEGELRVLLYIIRRTFGFKKESDDISLKQMIEGITTRDGRVLDHGAGVVRSAAVRAVKGLEEKGIVVAIRNSSQERGDEPTTYTLRFVDSVFSKRTGGSSLKELGGVLQRNTQQTVVQERDSQGSMGSNGPPAEDAGDNLGITHLAARKRRLQTPHLDHVIEDLTTQLHDDPGNTQVNQSRARRLMSKAGLDEPDMVQAVYEARTETLSSNVQKPAKDGRNRNKMPYFFAVVEDLLGLKDEQLPAGGHEQG